MCGIVGAAAQRNIVPVLIEGLRRLEYRGYDSCGVAVLGESGPARARSVARVADLDEQVRESQLGGITGIAHTRWATHGAPVTDNAHPIFSKDALALVHNGIIENYESLREMLRGKGYTFVSQTDTEVIAHLIHSLYRGDLFATVREAVGQLHGAYAIAVLHKDQPHTVVGARQGSPLVVGLGDGENFLASDALALAGSTERFIFLEEGDVCELTLEGVRIADREGNEALREVRQVAAYGGAVELGPYRHFMQKEIFEQPRAISDTIPPSDSFDASLFGEGAGKVFADIDNLLILACGTSYYSGLTAKYWLESIAKIPTQVEIASEYRYRESVPNPKSLVVVISQSGETADTLAALKHAQTLGHRHTLAVCNVGTSAMVRQTELAFLTHAGREIGVASTKAFTTQLVALFVLAVTLAKLRGRVSPEQEAEYFRQLRHLPAALNSVLALEPQIIAWSEEFSRKEHALFLGRGMHYPIALEGALKLKEISYIHAEAYPAGELKHGPLALVTEAMPVVTVAPNDALLEKLKSNIQEVRARGGQLYVFADADTKIVNDEGLHVIRMPEHYGVLSPILHVVPLQLLAYHTACARGTDVDKPRNLAKSVTVE
ncbi:glutamine--fructose-6-phosphate transaminase [Paraburkholderia sp. GV068]|jgi:glucosamine--fructose-6-phosphate aminotransferase (isomerizing)|uniref:Glutamine--fructose-6-phosphate aminotransferase [isomerizing] n=1 Tax=Paraburkholderia graminis TaxID=60548 RepID=A0ABD5CEP1_9BURK|nr:MULTISPECIES: glutamine--fructose-6-phosphate transaminase (isomerizing) [Paraburkholderia]ALE56172.1 glucosamine--fructose-6-phosphate aminotransferase [Burkholderia sp. HB1]MDQ0621038.1 glucosamine--fructose-6-phosphate aminotransferase (isomerizing) [Paraburkholderia graminis]MDR6202304.1 glucosamine--fructose-6-phosphate aminotransferase (isomerizing) [Paraburkholderia graminis]PTQ94493.1 glutamine--fructose-6-phosphate transaminase [Paraburkholderia sp. GV072]PUB01643.1 glutamine--fruc